MGQKINRKLRYASNWSIKSTTRQPDKKGMQISFPCINFWSRTRNSQNRATRSIDGGLGLGLGLGLPDVFGKTIFDEFLVLVLVEAHEDGVIASFRACLEVEHHRTCFVLTLSTQHTHTHTQPREREQRECLFLGFSVPIRIAAHKQNLPIIFWPFLNGKTRWGLFTNTTFCWVYV